MLTDVLRTTDKKEISYPLLLLKATIFRGYSFFRLGYNISKEIFMADKKPFIIGTGELLWDVFSEGKRAGLADLPRGGIC